MSELHINARFLTQPVSGTQRYAQQVLDALDRAVPVWEGAPRIVAWAPIGERREPGWANIEIRTTGRTSGHLWEQTELARAASGGWLLNLISSGPIIHPRQIVTLHDAAIFRHPGQFSRSYGMFHRLVRPALARRARRICTVSAFSMHALAEHMQVPPAKFAVIPNGADHLLGVASDPAAIGRRGLVPGRYILFVGNRAPHKNFETALAAFRALDRLDMKLVTVGIGLKAVFGVADDDGGPRVEHLTEVADAELRALYENAALLIFPSRYEGFGIPPLEAMSLGCPVVASNAAAIPETVGDAALLVSPDDAGGMKDAMLRIIDGPALRAELIEKGRARAQLFTWEEAGRKLRLLLGETMNLHNAKEPM